MSVIVSFDYGQTLAELDAEFLSSRLSERGTHVQPSAIREASPAAWHAYNVAKREGLAGHDAWCLLMAHWLRLVGVEQPIARELAEWLWTEQPTKNLWRRPIAGMFELVEELERAQVPLCIVSNSEGRLRDLLNEIGRARHFGMVVDSGLYDFEKPDRRMFELAATHFERDTSELIHIGDAWEADVVGALGAGARAVWFAPSEQRELPSGVRACSNAAELRRTLVSWGAPLS